EKVHNWRDCLRLHCSPLDKYVPEWPSNPSDFKPESDRPRLSESSACDDVPVIDLGLEDRTQVVKLIAEACKSYGSFQVTNHGVSLEAVEKMLEVAPDRVL
ncbi:hypothetical protein CMV_005701, partial [Castanea mollissima]